MKASTPSVAHPGATGPTCRERFAAVRAHAAGTFVARTLTACTFAAAALVASAAPASTEHYLALNRAALARYEAGHFDDAARMLREALAGARRDAGENDDTTLALENNLAAMLVAEGHHRDAEPHFSHVLAVREATRDADDPEVLLARNNLAEALQAEGRYRHAEALLRSIHAARVRTQGEQHPDTLQALNNLAAVLAQRGALEEAERLQRRALDAQRKALAEGDPAVLTSLANLAVVLDSQGRHADAETLHREVLDARTRALGPLHPSTLLARENLAAALYAQARYDDAVALLQGTADIARRALGARHPLTLSAMDVLASAYAQLGRFDDAETLHRMVYTARVDTLGDTHPDTLLAMNNLAESLHGRGRVDEAASLFARAVDGSDAALGPLHPTSIHLRTNQARYLLAANRHAEALVALRTLEPRLRGRQEYDAARARSAGRLQRLDREDANFVDLVLTLATHAPDVAGQYAADVIVRTKYLGAETDAVVEHAARHEPDPDIAALAQRVRTHRAFIARAAHRVGNEDAEALHRALNALETDEAALARRSHAFASVREHAAHASAASVAAALPAGALLLDVRRFHDDLQPDTAVADRYAVALIAADGHAEVRDLGPIAATRDAVHDVGDLDSVIEDDTHDTARTLYAALFGGLDARIAAAEHVYLAPDGPLHGVPFHALVLADGRYWIQRQPLRVIGTARDLLQAPRMHEGDGLLAIGGVDYGAGGAQPAFVPLPGSRREAEALHAHWQARGLPTQVWTGGGATEGALKALRTAPDYLHLATHGFFAEGPETAHLPLLASGVALAGANGAAGRGGGAAGGSIDDAAGDAADDGILYAEEALDLALDGTELVVLSACETARGVDTNWEGSLGLVRALRTAGARNVISSLWQISDEYAVPFMQAFYDRLLADPARNAAAALRTTQLEWIGASEPGRSYPENWAGFVLVQRR